MISGVTHCHRLEAGLCSRTTTVLHGPKKNSNSVAIYTLIYVVRYAVLAYCSKYYKYLKGFASLSYSNAAWLTNSKCGIQYALEKNLKYLICLLFFTYSCANSKFLTGFVGLTNLITYLTNVEAFV